MLDPKYVRENKKLVEENLKKRGFKVSFLANWLNLDEKRGKALAQVNQLREERNQLTEKFKKGKPDEKEAQKARKVREEIQSLEKELSLIEAKWQEALFQLPNILADDVPSGKDDGENVEVKTWGEKPKFDFDPKDHVDIGERLGIIDIKRAGKVSGPRFGYFKGDGALLELGLMWHAFAKLAKKGFVPVIPPVMTKKETERGLGYMEHGGWDNAYLFEKDGLVLVPSSEHSVIPMHKDEVLEEKELPKRFVNFSTCFRREAGAYGKDTRGLFRVHQFNKVEMNVYTFPDFEVSDKECSFLLSLEEELMQELGLSYRVMFSCGGDEPFPNRRMYDLETWFPGQGKYRETQSCSNCADFQTRRLNIRAKTKEGNRFVHALNATLVTDRAVLAILENYQQKDGSVLVPSVLQQYLGKKVIK